MRKIETLLESKGVSTAFGGTRQIEPAAVQVEILSLEEQQ